MCQAQRKKELTCEQKTAIANWLSKQEKDGKMRRGAFSDAVKVWEVSRSTINRIWNAAQSLSNKGEAIILQPKKKGYCGQKRKHVDMQKVKTVAYAKRGTIRSLALAIGESKSTIHRLIKLGFIKPHNSAPKPTLTDINVGQRLNFCLNTIEEDSFFSNPVFEDMYNHIHVDEKWFYMTKGKQKYYLLPCEDKPYRTVKSKRFIQKVMFLAAVARPRFNSDGDCIFDGKLGIFPFVRWVPAKRSSKNRRAGTLELKPVTAVTKEAYRSKLINKLLPAILQKWPTDDDRPIIIQQDNARPHIAVDDEAWLAAVQATNKDIRLVCQPPNSPDLNVLDLGFFNAIQALKDQTSPKNCQQLVSNVKQAYKDFCPVKGNRVFLTLQLVMIEIMKQRGSNKYKLQHVGKEALERQSLLPVVFSPPTELIEQCVMHMEVIEDPIRS